MEVLMSRIMGKRSGGASPRFDFMEFVMRILPARATGEPAEFARRYGGARACGDAGALADAMRRKTASYYLMLAMALVVAGAAAAQQLSAGGAIGPTEREGPYGAAQYIDAQVSAEYRGESIEKQVSVTVLPEAPEPSETAAALDGLMKRLPEAILGQNTDIKAVVYDLDLMGEDEETGALIGWDSDNPDAIDEDGRVNLIDGKPGDTVTLTAEITLGEATDSLEITAATGDPGAAHDYARDLDGSVDRLVSALSDNDEGRTVTLPGSTDTGIAIDWSKPRDRGALAAVFVLPVIAVFVYRSRYRGMDKAVAEMRDGIKRDFPDFLAKLLLLLNAGLVVTAAVEKIADDYRERRRPGEEKVFFEELLGMEDRIRGANTSLTAEFAGLAARSGQREVMRFSAILADNIDKGSALADKLMQEEGMLRAMRKKRAEEKGRLAETKLTFPMALQLGAIIIITVAPAAFEMR
jgi:hypothetical protein